MNCLAVGLPCRNGCATVSTSEGRPSTTKQNQPCQAPTSASEPSSLKRLTLSTELGLLLLLTPSGLKSEGAPVARFCFMGICGFGRPLDPLPNYSTSPPTMTTANEHTTPLLRIGTFGTHLIKGTYGYSFVGTVPTSLRCCKYLTLDEGLAAFVMWFKDQDLAFQREHVGDLRNDVFTLLLTH